MTSSVKESLVALDDILSKHIGAHNKLSETADLLREALVASDHEAIERAARENEKAAAIIRALENRRIELIQESGIVNGSDDSFTAIEDNLSLDELGESEREVFESIRSKRTELGLLIHDVDHQNQLNMTLISQALEFHDFSLKLLWHTVSGESGGYSPDGSKYTDQVTGLFDGVA